MLPYEIAKKLHEIQGSESEESQTKYNIATVLPKF